MIEVSKSTQSHFVAVFGPPSGLSEFIVFIIYQILRITVENFEHIGCSDAVSLQAAWNQRSSDSFLLFSDCPDQPIANLFIRTQVPILLIKEDPSISIHYIINKRKMTPDWAARLLEQSTVTTHPLAQHGNTLTIDNSGILFSDFVKRIVDHFSLDLLPFQYEELARSILVENPRGNDCSLADAFCLSHLANLVSDYKPVHETNDITRSILSDITRIQSGETLTQLSWLTPTFLTGSERLEPYSGTSELIGPARFLFYGPFRYLQKGIWELTADLSVSENFSGNTIEFDIYHDEIIISKSVNLSESSTFQVIAQFECHDPRIPFQFRARSLEGAIEGRLTLKSTNLKNINSIF